MTTWDEAKNRANIAKHGVSFDLAERFDLDGAMIEEDRDIDHEQRFSRDRVRRREALLPRFHTGRARLSACDQHAPRDAEGKKEVCRGKMS
jgi:uncharacterized DUF497 family protein